MEKNVYFVSGIDTNVGKSYATGFLARAWNGKGVRTITQKLVQTGNEGASEDIALHRRIMGCGWLREDEERLTMPEIFSYPCSPHLASELDKRPTRDCLTIDYVVRKGYPLVLVTSGRLGSISHTLLSLEAIRSRGICLHAVVYNLYPEGEDRTIQQDTEMYLREYVGCNFKGAEFILLPCLGL